MRVKGFSLVIREDLLNEMGRSSRFRMDALSLEGSELEAPYCLGERLAQDSQPVAAHDVINVFGRITGGR